MQFAAHRYVWFATLLAMLGVAIIVGAWQINSSGDNSNSTGNTPSEIRELIPAESSQVPRQSTIGIELEPAPGNEEYDIRLWLNDEPLPLDEADKSNTRFTYRPGEGKAIEELEIGENCIRAEYYPRSNQGANPGRYRWCFEAA